MSPFQMIGYINEYLLFDAISTFPPLNEEQNSPLLAKMGNGKGP